jgi:type IV pilus assembly protein PilQ
MVDNGGTVVLGGIYQQTERSTTDKVPLLGDVPVLGYLFRSNGRTNDKTELLVFITPKIVADLALIRRAERADSPQPNGNAS